MELKFEEYIQQLKNHEIEFYEIPERDRGNRELLYKIEHTRNLKSHKTFCFRGFDIIRKSFFVEKYSSEKGFELVVFEDFDSFYNYLEGDIYPCSCYYQYYFTSTEIEKYGLDQTKINTQCLTSLRYFNITPETAYKEYADIQEEKIKKKQEEQLHEATLQSIREKYEKKVCSATTYDDFCKQIEIFKKEYEQSAGEYSSYASIQSFLRKYMENYQDYAFDIVMKYISAHMGFPRQLLPDLFHYYNPDAVFKAYNPSSVAKSTKARYRGKMRKCISAYKDNPEIFTQEYSKLIIANSNEENLNNSIENPNKEDVIVFHSRYEKSKNSFLVSYEGFYGGRPFQSDTIEFNYFFDLVAFFDGKLSDSDLLFCDGLSNLQDWSNIDFTHARLTSKLQEKFGVYSGKDVFVPAAPKTFPFTLKNENDTIKVLVEQRIDNDFLDHCKRVCYISDLHLLHQIHNSKCQTENDVIYFVSKLVEQIKRELQEYNGDYLLIGGDVSSVFSIYSLFIETLEQAVHIPIFVILGNHELWAFPNNKYDEIVEKYRTFLLDHHILLLENDLVCDFGVIASPRFLRYSEQEILSISPAELRSQLIKARLIVFGGLGFAGLNDEFNAREGIYRSVVSREQEIEYSNRMAKLYSKVSDALSDKTVVVCTHNPIGDWSKNGNPQKGFYYVSGHTHNNSYYEDGIFHIYSDNQIGYSSRQVHLKYFSVDGSYDLFSDWDDGIYEITRKQYIDFNYGKYIRIDFNREYRKLYMLKRKGYYMFVIESLIGSLCILNGGTIKKLDEYDIRYYYDKMDAVVSYLKGPTDQFGLILQKVSRAVKQIGGSGKIHGCIVDIDFYNHIYVNHLDFSLTGYWAWDVIDKEAYISIPSLLKHRCPELYDRYQKLLAGKQGEALAIIKNDVTNIDLPPVYYPSTDIYISSRYIKKLQRLDSNILSEWREPSFIAIDS